MALTLNGWKGLSMALFTVITVIGAAIAVFMKEKAKQIHLTCGVMFSAGVLLAGGFVHMLGDSNEGFEQYAPNFPWAFAIAGVTVVVLASMEISMERIIGDTIEATKKKKESSVDADKENAPDDFNGGEIDEEFEGNKVPLQFSTVVDDDASHVHDMVLDGTNPFSAVLLTLALSLHVFIEGLGLGAQTDISEFGTAFIAVAIHKGFVSFALAENMVSSGYWKDHSKRKYFYLSLGLFILMTLVGIAIGWGISSSGEESITTAVFTAMMSGSFIFVAIIEILPQEANIIKKERLAIIPVLFFFLAGYILMSLLAIWA